MSKYPTLKVDSCLTSIRLVCKNLSRTNTLAYLAAPSVTKRKVLYDRYHVVDGDAVAVEAELLDVETAEKLRKFERFRTQKFLLKVIKLFSPVTAAIT